MRQYTMSSPSHPLTVFCLNALVLITRANFSAGHKVRLKQFLALFCLAASLRAFHRECRNDSNWLMCRASLTQLAHVISVITALLKDNKPFVLQLLESAFCNQSVFSLNKAPPLSGQLAPMMQKMPRR